MRHQTLFNIVWHVTTRGRGIGKMWFHKGRTESKMWHHLCPRPLIGNGGGEIGPERSVAREGPETIGIPTEKGTFIYFFFLLSNIFLVIIVQIVGPLNILRDVPQTAYAATDRQHWISHPQNCPCVEGGGDWLSLYIISKYLKQLFIKKFVEEKFFYDYVIENNLYNSQ